MANISRAFILSLGICPRPGTGFPLLAATAVMWPMLSPGGSRCRVGQGSQPPAAPTQKGKCSLGFTICILVPATSCQLDISDHCDLVCSSVSAMRGTPLSFRHRNPSNTKGLGLISASRQSAAFASGAASLMHGMARREPSLLHTVATPPPRSLGLDMDATVSITRPIRLDGVGDLTGCPVSSVSDDGCQN